MNLKVTDFGGAETTNINCPEHLIGTISYMAPEIFAKITYDGRKVDVFALGVLLSILVKGTMPFRCAKVDDPYYRMLISGQNNLYWQKV
jgi:MAP/microtubule affinity-regulating kinase